jgi:spore coat polysaccharide biosynthesis protein SpsF
MVVGQSYKKIGFIIQARMQSARLPGKTLLSIPLENGKPLLSWIIDELNSSTLDKEIIVATSTNEENNILALFCQENGVQCFRGSEENVLSRFTTIARQKKYDCIVRLTADNPFIDVSILDETVIYHLHHEYDYTNTDTLPLGMNFEVISASALLDIEKHSITDTDKEHVTLFLKNNNMYKRGIYFPKIEHDLKGLRLTIDYASDFTLASAILSMHSQNAKKGLKLIEEIYTKFSWLFESNISNIQKRQHLDINEEIKAARTLLEIYDLKRAADFLIKNEK